MRWVRPRSMRSHSCGGDQARQQIVGEDALGALFAAVDGEGDALGEKREIGGLLAALQFLGRQVGQGFSQGAVLGPQFALRLAHLIEGLVERVVAEQRVQFRRITGAHVLRKELVLTKLRDRLPGMGG